MLGRLRFLIPLFAILSLSFTYTLTAQDTLTPSLDADWYRERQILAADRWNGGMDGQSGMGSYRDDFDGFFHVNLDRQWRQTPMRATSAVAQSRGIFMNVEAYIAAGAEDGQRFMDAAIKGAEFLMNEFWDAENGGFFWMVSPRGTVADSMKQGYGNVHPMLALTRLYEITHDPQYLDAAIAELEVIKEHFLDPDYPGGILPGFNRDFTEIIGVKNVDTFTHLFETLLALYDVTEGDQRGDIADMIALHGDFLTEHLYHDQDGFTDRGYVAYNYDEAWQPAQQPYTRDTQWSGAMHATTGHNIELAFLLSRAVERGFNPDWLDVAEKMIRFDLEYAMHPVYGGMIYETTDHEGQPLPGNPDNPLFIWWAQAETARALLHFSVVRGDDYVIPFRLTEHLFNDTLTDPEYAGLYYSLDSTRDLAPVGNGKGDIWKTNYHYSMYFAEVLRLAAEYPEQFAAVQAQAAGVALP